MPRRRMSNSEKAARATLRGVAERLEQVETERDMLLTLRAQVIVDAKRRGLSQEAIGVLLGLTKQRVGQIAQEVQADMQEAMR
jgi:uncharacterized protein (UPF0335 family)